MATIKISRITGVEACKQSIEIAHNYIKKCDKPVEEMKNKIREYVELNFESEGTVFGSKWQRLSPSTIKHKEYLKSIGKSKYTYETLLRTGKMRESFKYVIKKKKGGSYITVYNTAPYFSKHQSKNPSARTTTTQGMTTEKGFKKGRPKTIVLPRRIMLSLNDTLIREMMTIVEKWFNKTPNTTKATKSSKTTSEWTSDIYGD